LRAVTKFIPLIFCRSARARAISLRWLCGNVALSFLSETRVPRWKWTIQAFPPDLARDALRTVLCNNKEDPTKPNRPKIVFPMPAKGFPNYQMRPYIITRSQSIDPSTRTQQYSDKTDPWAKLACRSMPFLGGFLFFYKTGGVAAGRIRIHTHMSFFLLLLSRNQSSAWKNRN
jgi:hypothetical protein